MSEKGTSEVWTDSSGRGRNHSVTHTTRWKLHVCAPDTQQTDESDVFRLLGGDTFTHLYHFANRLRKEHYTELLRIERGLIFLFQHRQHSEGKMDGFKRNMLVSFQHLINRPSTHKNYDVSLEVLEEKSGHDNVDRMSTSSETQLQLQSIEARLQERMSCEIRNMENLVRTLIQENQTYMEGEIQSIALTIRSSQPDTTNRHQTHERDATLVPTDRGAKVPEQVPETTAGTTPKGDSVRSKGTCVGEEQDSPAPHTTDSYQDNNAEEGKDTGLGEMSSSPGVDQTNVPTTGTVETGETGIDDTGETHTSLVRSKNIQQASSSEIISKNYYEAQRLLTDLTIDLDGWERLTVATALALEAAHPQPPRTKSAVTVLCVDVSESIGENGLRELKQMANKFIDDVSVLGGETRNWSKGRTFTVCVPVSGYRIRSPKSTYAWKRAFLKTEGTVSNIEAVAGAFIGDMTHEEKDLVIKAVKEKIEKKDDILPDDGPSDFDNVLERDGLPPLGSRVMRGPDWRYGDQDVGGHGTIVNHANDHRKKHVLLGAGCAHVFPEI